MMLGHGDIEIAVVFWLYYVSSLDYVAYGIFNCNNKGNELIV